MTDLNTQIITAHEQGDIALLVDLYDQAAKTSDNVDAACFFATQAYILALDTNHEKRDQLHRFLCDHKREE